MPATRKRRPRGNRITPSRARWMNAAKEAGTAAVLAALPILIKSLSEALPVQAQPERSKSAGKKRKPAAH